MSRTISTPLAQLRLLLLDLISPRPAIAQSRIDALSDEEWRTLLGMAHKHRLGPMLHWQLGKTHAHLEIPQGIRDELAASHRKSALRALLIQRELVVVHRVLKRSGVPHVALKGAFLAFHAYPHSALRPLRDLDILAPKDRVLATFQALIDGGLTRADHAPGSPEAWLLLHRHLPPLRSPGGIMVELHSRLMDMDEGEEEPDLSDSPEFWERCVAVRFAGDGVPCESSTDLLLDLIVHAVYHHQFDNGPLLLSDIAFLLATHPIDWPLFWRLAAQGRQTRGCRLALMLVEHYWGKQPIGWPEEGEPDAGAMAAQIESAALLMLRDFGAILNGKLGGAMAAESSLSGKIRVLFSRLFWSKTKLAMHYPVSEHSWRVYLWYPVQWWERGTGRLPTFLRTRRDPQQRGEERQLAELKSWLRCARTDS